MLWICKCLSTHSSRDHMRIFKAYEEYMHIIPPLNPYEKKITSKQIFQNSRVIWHRDLYKLVFTTTLIIVCLLGMCHLIKPKISSQYYFDSLTSDTFWAGGLCDLVQTFRPSLVCQLRLKTTHNITVLNANP